MVDGGERDIASIKIKTMKLENTKAQMRRGILEMCILAIIHQEGEAYPSDIIKSLKVQNLIVVEGTLYPLLSRLKKTELLDYSWKESKSGPPRKYYTLTEKGEGFLSELYLNWTNLAKAVSATTKSLAKD